MKKEAKVDEQVSILEAAELMYRILAAAVTKKNISNLGKQPPRNELYIAKQTDIAGEYRIFVDFPTERYAIKNQYIARITIMLDGSGIDLILRGWLLPRPKRFPQGQWRSVKNLAKKTVDEF